MKECSTFSRQHQHWTWEGRMALQTLWNANVNRGRNALSMRAFVRIYRLSHGRLQHELKADWTGKLLYDEVHRCYMCLEYSAIQVQEAANRRDTAKGRAPMVTNHFAERLIKCLKEGFFMATCLYQLRNES